MTRKLLACSLNIAMLAASACIAGSAFAAEPAASNTTKGDPRLAGPGLYLRRMSRCYRLQECLSELPCAAHRGPEFRLSGRSADRVQKRRTRASDHACTRRESVRAGHQQHRRLSFQPQPVRKRHALHSSHHLACLRFAGDARFCRRKCGRAFLGSRQDGRRIEQILARLVMAPTAMAQQGSTLAYPASTTTISSNRCASTSPVNARTPSWPAS